jgi:hypothetical protein
MQAAIFAHNQLAFPPLSSLLTIYHTPALNPCLIGPATTSASTVLPIHITTTAIITAIITALIPKFYPRANHIALHKLVRKESRIQAFVK